MKLRKKIGSFLQLANDFPRERPTVWDFALISLLRQQSSGELGYFLVPKVLEKLMNLLSMKQEQRKREGK